MTELEPWATTLGVVLAAALASAGTVLASRWSHRNEQTRIRYELVEILGRDRDALSEAANKARQRAQEVDEELEKVRDDRRVMADELAAAKIAHREQIAELVAQHRAALEERDLQRRQIESTLTDCRRQIAEIERELRRATDQLEQSREMVSAQANVIAEYRARLGAGGGETR